MPTLSPTEALNACERALRELMTHAYAQRDGSGWLARISTDRQRERWEERAGEEAKRRKSVVTVPAAGLSYSEFYELVEFARKDWEPLAVALGKRADTLPLLDTFENLRNTVAHGRPLHTFEADLYSGIAGTIRNQVTIYMSAQDDAGEYYPRITAARDSLGNEVEIRSDLGEMVGSSQTDVVVRPGDVVVFTVVGVDPQGRQLEWDFMAQGSPTDKLVSESGKQIEWTWTVAGANVGESIPVTIHMRAFDSEYFRAYGFDHRTFFMYRVRPPHAL